MEDKYPIYYQEDASEQETEVLLKGIAEAATARGMSKILPFALLVKDQNQKILAGAKGVSIYGALYIDLLWVSAHLRGQGIGTKLMDECEKLAKKRGCTFVNLITMDWEALPFYQKLGYQLEYVRHGYEQNSKMNFLKKDLY